MNLLKKFLILCLFAFSLTSCVSSDLIYLRDQQANHVRIVDYLKPSLKNNLVEIDQVKCHLGSNSHSLYANMVSCENYMANIADKMGGSYVLCDSSNQEISPEVPGYIKCVTREGETDCYNTGINKGSSNIVNYRCIVYKEKGMPTKEYNLAIAETEEKIKAKTLAESRKILITYESEG